MKLCRLTLFLLMLVNICKVEGSENIFPKSNMTSDEATFGYLTSVNKGEEVTLPMILEKGLVLAMSSWSFIEEEKLMRFFCIVTFYQNHIDHETLPGRKLSFYKEKDTKLIKKYEFETGDSFLAMYPLSVTNGNLLTIWGSGSAYHFDVFSFKDNEIKIVLEAGSKALPEIVDLDNDGEYEILIWRNFEPLKNKENKKDGFFETKRLYKWKTADIYKWDGKAYRLIRTVPWASRLSNLGRKILK